MSKPTRCDLPDLVEPETPLPWTTGGPNSHSKLQQTASSSLPVSVADSVYQYKNRVINMKQFEAIKKRLPRGIDVRISSKNVLSFRVRFRRKGYPDQIKTFPDEKLAKQWLAEQERNALMGIHFPQVRASEHTLSEAIDRYFIEALPKIPGNYRNVRHHLEWFREELGKYALSAIRPSILTEKRTILEQGITNRNKNRSSTTVRRYLTSLSHLFTIAVRDWEWMSENPMKKISKPQAAPGRQRYLSKDERFRLFEAIKNSKCPILYVVFAIAISTGMRRGEIMNLRWTDIDFQNNKIVLKKTKNGEPRNIPLIGTTLNAVLEHRNLRLKVDPQDLVFASPNNPNKPYDIQTAWKSALKHANIENFSFHDIRHSTASYQAAYGRNLFEIGNLLGHKSPQTTKRYAHLTYEHTTQMVEELDQEIFGA